MNYGKSINNDDYTVSVVKVEENIPHTINLHYQFSSFLAHYFHSDYHLSSVFELRVN